MITSSSHRKIANLGRGGRAIRAEPEERAAATAAAVRISFVGRADQPDANEFTFDGVAEVVPAEAL